MKTSLRSIAACLALLAIPLSAFAHPGHDLAPNAFAAGFAHPFTGIDHLFAILAVGVWASQLEPRARAWIPMAFIMAMGLGAALATGGWRFDATEQMVATSLFVFGLLVSLAFRMPVARASAPTMLFAMFHGVAHGAELSALGSVVSWMGGFVLPTAVILTAGVLTGCLCKDAHRSITRWLGGAIAAVGATLVFSGI